MLNSLFGGGELGPAAAARGPGHDFQAEFDRAEAERLRARSANPDAFPALPAGRRSEGGPTAIDGDVDAPAPARHHRPAETDANVGFRSEFPTLGAPSAAVCARCTFENGPLSFGRCELCHHPLG